MNSLPHAIYTAEQVRALDRATADAIGEPIFTLMLRAGAASFDLLRSCWPQARRIVVVCGPGNNGGDGYVLARLAREAGLDVQVLATADPGLLKGDAQRAYEQFASGGGAARVWRDEPLPSADVIVDAIFGTGLSRPLESQALAQVQAMNASGAPLLALDIPSGLHADTGAVLGAAIRASRTISFVGLKIGFYLGDGPDHTGRIACDQLGAPPEVLASAPMTAMRIETDLLVRLLPPRHRMAHKGDQRRLLIVGGGAGMAGAARMAGEAALRSGAGLVTVATRPENVPAIVGARPELICRGVQNAQELQTLLDRAEIIALGPGLGQDEWSRAMFETTIAACKPMIVDADGLNLLAQTPMRNAHWVLTPHPGEAARLLGSNGGAIQRDRLGSVRQIAERYGGVAVLKGVGTLVYESGAEPAICDRGNPGMASPGMGDVLTGVIAGIAAQTPSLTDPAGGLADAARAGVLVHAMAGDLAAARGERGLIATDLFAHLQECVNPTQRN